VDEPLRHLREQLSVRLPAVRTVLASDTAHYGKGGYRWFISM
jgi:hypothetical protein